MTALLNWQQMRPHAKYQKSLVLGSAHGDFPADWEDLTCEKKKPGAIRITYMSFLRGGVRLTPENCGAQVVSTLGLLS